MCRQPAVPAVSTIRGAVRYPVKENSDEVWEAGSYSDSGSECESEPESAKNLLQQLQREKPEQQRQQRRLQQQEVKSAGRTSGAKATASDVTTAGNNPISLPRLALSQQQLQQQQQQQQQQRRQQATNALQSHPMPAQPSGLMGLVGHLRSDNERLREALVQAQRETEAAVLNAERAGYAGAGMDFAHLLSLVKEFGDLGGGDYWDDEEISCAVGMDMDTLVSPVASTTTEVFSMHSPRDHEVEDLGGCSHDSEVGNDCPDEKKALRKELEASRRETEQLKALLAARDAELREARGTA